MEKIRNTDELNASIIFLESKKASEMQLLKEQFKITSESMKPANLIKNKINEIITSPDLKENLINATISLAAGYLSKKALVGSTHNPLKQLFGTLLQLGVTSVVAKNTDGIKSTTMTLLNTLLGKGKS